MTTCNEVVEVTILNNASAVHKHLPFVHKLYLMLQDMEAKGYGHIISWIGDGKAFKIHNPSLFEASIQRKYFSQSRVASFIRQLYGYGFTKIEDRSNMYFGAYVHPDFQRDHPTRACTIQRRSNLGTRDRRFKKNTSTAVEVHRTRPCGTNANVYYRNDSLSSLEAWWIPIDDAKPEVSLDSDWKTVRPRTSPVVDDHTSESLLPSHVNLADNWLADLQRAFCPSPSHHNSASCSNGILRFEEFKCLFEPRPIECMIKK